MFNQARNPRASMHALALYRIMEDPVESGQQAACEGLYSLNIPTRRASRQT